MNRDIAVIGGGAAGMMAAIAAADRGGRVTIYEKNDRVGKKILATGNGKCNLSNRDMDISHYYTSHPGRLEQILEKFTAADTVDFFESAGMMVKDKNGYLYPVSEQASTVLDILRLRLKEAGVTMNCDSEVGAVEKQSDGKFAVITEKQRYLHNKVIVAGGSRASLKSGEGQSGYRLAEAAGHSIVPVVPALVQLRCREAYIKALAGVRCQASLKLLIAGECRAEEWGELQFTEYGISGIPVFQFSREAAYALDRGNVQGNRTAQGEKNTSEDKNIYMERNVFEDKNAHVKEDAKRGDDIHRDKNTHKGGSTIAVEVDFFPDFPANEYALFCQRRYKTGGSKTLEEFLLGMANKKINQVIIKLNGCRGSDLVSRLGEVKILNILGCYKVFRLQIAAVNPFAQAQVCAGGVDLAEVSENLESLKLPGLYFAGEMLDVDGKCGGYNLQWAWSSGYVAGVDAVKGTR